MAFNHRRLISDSSISNFCEDYCNTESNEDGKCPYACFSLCYPICNQPLDPPPSPKHHLSKPFIISLAIFATAFSFFFAFAIYRFYKAWNSSRRRRSQPQTDLEETTHDEFLDEDHGPFVDHPIWYIRTIGLQPSIINAITVCKYKSGEGLVEGTECSVCLSEFEEDETLRLLPKCNHAFHIPCIDTWLRSHTNCPMCRAGIIAGVTASPSPEPNLDHPDAGEETTQVGNSENSTELGREREDGACELRIGIEEESDENGISKEEVGSSESSDHIPMRRSVSLDSLSASMISLAVNNCIPTQSAENSNTQLVKLKESNLGIVPKRVDVNQSLLRLVGSSSIGRSLQKGPISMKRSLSCSGKVLLSRFSRSRNSVLPS